MFVKIFVNYASMRLVCIKNRKNVNMVNSRLDGIKWGGINDNKLHCYAQRRR